MSFTIDETNVVYADLQPTEGVVLNLKTKNYYKLNETGQLVWQGLAAKKTTSQIVEGLTHIFDVTKTQAELDVSETILFLKNAGLVLEDKSTVSANVAAAHASKKETNRSTQ